jgi:acyl-CoA thioesterase-2
MPIIDYEDMLGCLEIECFGENEFTAPNIPMPYSRLFGGQLLAQCCVIAAATAEGKHVKSMHVIFPREGDLATPIDYHVERLHDGRSFSTRSVVGAQEGRTIFSASVSLHVLEAGLSYQEPGPKVVVAGPEACPPVDLSMIPWETRAVDGVDLASRDLGPPHYAMWMRTPALDREPVVHQALLAHATDLTMIGTALRPHPDLGEVDSPDRIHTAVTSHTVWFHRPLRVDDWVLLTQTSPCTAGARGFVQGHAFTRESELVASFAQESMLRLVV